jgi:hypothetical protein
MRLEIGKSRYKDRKGIRDNDTARRSRSPRVSNNTQQSALRRLRHSERPQFTMGIDALKSGFEVIEWDQGIYETLPIDKKTFRRIKERQVSEEVHSQIR